ncbi:MAG: hypothetical protein M1818_001873 [Claussenomyces sp. TS43310]|nr:MAG: hypothetical protein M1818_001873 [Claussenomyces sp. TS43310]
MDLIEAQNARDGRIEHLWRQLDTARKGELDLKGLRKGLQKIDHRGQSELRFSGWPLNVGPALKDANELLEQIMKAVDTNQDGRIQYEGWVTEFRAFVEHTEKELSSLFRSIDCDRDGKVDKGELERAFKEANLTVPGWKLNEFFKEVDTNQDGVITFDEWRDFLLFLPTSSPGLKAVLSYYSSAVTLNAEGDAMFSDDTIQGLGTSLQNFLKILFGSLINIASPSHGLSGRIDQHVQPFQVSAPQGTSLDENTMFDPLSAPTRNTDTPQETAGNSNPQSDESAHSAALVQTRRLFAINWDLQDLTEFDFSEDIDVSVRGKKLSLIWLFPDPGYFAAGGIAGVVSRTSTAPLDRLKVYLIANTGEVARDTLDAAKKGRPTTAVKHIGRPLIDATKELWKAGGWRSLFAGNGLNVIKVMPESAIKFGSYEGAKRALAHIEGHGDSTEINPVSKFIAGGLGGMAAQLCVYPLDTLKFRMQCNVEINGPRGNALIVDTAKKMYQSGGIRSAYRGLTMGLIGMFPYSAIDLATFEFLKGRIVAYKARTLHLEPGHPDCLPGSFSTGAIGAFSGAFGASMVYPVNLLRTRLQAQGTLQHPPVYDGILDCARRTLSKEGVRGLFKGITPNLLKVVPAVSITYVVYENAKKAMHLR